YVLSPRPAQPVLLSLSLHDALPISLSLIELISGRSSAAKPTASPCTTPDAGCKVFDNRRVPRPGMPEGTATFEVHAPIERVWALDRKSTRLNSSHGSISSAVFCSKK